MSKAYIIETPFRPWQLLLITETATMFNQGAPLTPNQLESLSAFFKILSSTLMQCDPVVMAKTCLTIDRIKRGDYTIPDNFFDSTLTDLDTPELRLEYHINLEHIVKSYPKGGSDAPRKTPRQTH